MLMLDKLGEQDYDTACAFIINKLNNYLSTQFTKQQINGHEN